MTQKKTRLRGDARAVRTLITKTVTMVMAARAAAVVGNDKKYTTTKTLIKDIVHRGNNDVWHVRGKSET